MKFRMIVKDAREEEWNEDENRPEIKTLEEAEMWAKETVARFNAHLRPHETARTIVRVEALEEDSKVSASHLWNKTNLITIVPARGGSYDTYECTRCRITGKRFGLEAGIKRDKEFKAAGYANCDQSIKLLERRKKRREKLAQQERGR